MPLPAGPPLALTLFGLLLLLCMVPAWRQARRDPRTIRGVGVWTKPLKFLAALALFAFTTAVLMLAARDAAPATLWRIAALVMATSAFEAIYIAVQASRAEPSHYNTSDALHSALTVAMALGAIGLTASQAWLGWVIVRVNPDWLSSVAVLGAVTGLFMTWVLATLSGFMLGGRRAPPGPGLPLVGWQRRGDLRPAHFLGVHAQQIVPLLGLCCARLPASAAHAGFAALALGYVLAWAALTRRELHHTGVHSL
ncbi:hypothetical protein [Massilia sp. S19_KUP03_FR1]|uniref:hypothetical protein n=1 Tax=Massilia sp. S19_KUP03_FR1 TaxID=3025503 RepID=UPI002FCDD336